MRTKDLTGQKFGRLLAVRSTEERKGGFVVWECRCECGNTVFVKSGALKSGNTRSCGCLQKEKKDIAGRRFGRLTAIRATEERKGTTVVWECKCDCGNRVFVQRTALISGNTRSCGCLRKETASNIHRQGPNLEQRKVSKNSKTGHKGVRRQGDPEKYVAEIGFHWRNYYLGIYERLEDAIEVRKKTEQLIWEQGETFFKCWTEKADADPVWAKENPIRICVVKVGEHGYDVTFSPEI